jgi:hypothetical protein
VSEVHESASYDSPPVGYTACRIEVCGKWHLTAISNRTGGVCEDCHFAGLGAQFRRMEIVSLGRRTEVKANKNRRPNRKRPGRDSKPGRNLAHTAERRALKRLRRLFPELYDVLYAEERASVGLEPWPLDRALHHTAGDLDASSALAFARLGHELDAVGVSVDG